MKKVWLILGVVVAIVVLGTGITSAFAQDNGNGGTSGSLFCGEWLLGEIQVDPTSDVINLLPRGEDTPVGVAVNEDTKYRALMAPRQEITFDSLDDGDWIAVCLKDGVARVVILLEAPQKPFYLKLEGNVTGVADEEITVQIGEGKTFTVDLSNSGADTTGIDEGQSVSLTISERRPLLWRHYLGLHLEGAVESFKQRLENWQGQGMLQRFKQRFENWQGQGMLQRFKQRFENWQGWFGDEAHP
jgi:hypothetical protein